jgi:hypothetical protein
MAERMAGNVHERQMRGAQYWLGTEPGQLGVLGFKGVVAAAEGSYGEGRMGAGFCTLSWQKTPVTADEDWKGREIFLDEMGQVITEGYVPSKQLKRRLELMGVA